MNGPAGEIQTFGAALPDTDEQKIKSLRAAALMIKFTQMFRPARANRKRARVERDQLRNALRDALGLENQNDDTELVQGRLRELTSYFTAILEALESLRLRLRQAKQQQHEMIAALRTRGLVSLRQSYPPPLEHRPTIQPNAPAS
jgi:hypothetical protein